MTVRHRKIKAVACGLGIKPVVMLGHAHALWHAVLEQQEDGDLSGWTDELIAEYACYDGDAARFVALLQQEHLLDGRLVHDWLDYAGPYLIRRYKTRNRQRLVEIWAIHGRVYGNDHDEAEAEPDVPKGTTREPKGHPHGLTDRQTDRLRKDSAVAEAFPQPGCGKPEENPALPRSAARTATPLLERVLRWHMRECFGTRLPREQVKDQLSRTLAVHGHATIERLFDRVANGGDPHPKRFWEGVKALKYGAKEGNL